MIDPPNSRAPAETVISGATIQLPRSPAPRVSIIIPATAGPDLLHACLRSIARYGPSTIPYETIVVLNEVWDEDAARLKEATIGVQGGLGETTLRACVAGLELIVRSQSGP